MQSAPLLLLLSAEGTAQPEGEPFRILSKTEKKEIPEKQETVKTTMLRKKPESRQEQDFSSHHISELSYLKVLTSGHMQ
jgi:hypothetical protein